MSQAPAKTIIPPGTETCGCCDGISESTPVGIDNRRGLSSITYRIGAYAQFRASMIAGLSSSQYAKLATLRTRDADDYTLGLLDAVACAADVLTFYQERIANESYLRTAIERVSLQEMGKLIGYRLRPGVAAETQLAFALELPKTPPPSLPPEPGAFVTGIPAALTLAPGLKVQSVPGPGEKPQSFETVEPIVARPEWNAIRPWLSTRCAPRLDATETWVKGIANNLKVGDALVFADAEFLAHPTASTSWQFRLIDAVELDPAEDRTRVKWLGGLKRLSPLPDPPIAPRVYVLRKRAAVFGNNAPMWKSMNASFREDYPGGDPDSPEWPDLVLSHVPASAVGDYVDLDTVYSEVQPGGFAVLTRVNFAPELSAIAKLAPGAFEDVGVVPGMRTVPTELYTIATTENVSVAANALSGKITRIRVVGRDLKASFSGFVRETAVYVQSEPLTLAPYPVLDPIGGDALPLAVSSTGLEAGRNVVVSGAVLNGTDRRVHQATIVSAQQHANGAVVTITPPLPATLERSTVVVHANVASATHGETASQILGAGDASKRFQRFDLKRLPLTYRSAATESGADSELTVRVGDIEWTEKPTLFGAAPAARAYTLQTDEQGKTWVTFGDGARGARLPSGVNNVRATYRQGLGKHGNVAGGQLTQLMTRPLGLKSVSNPLPAQGGTDPEPADQARRTMPLGTRTLGRAVSLLDYEDFALAFTGIAKAQAHLLHLRGGPTVAITIAGQDGEAMSAGNPVWQNLDRALKANGDPHVRIALLSYKPSTFRLGLKIKRDPAYAIDAVLAAVEKALRSHYSFDSRALAQPVLQSDVIAVAHSVPGVVAVDLDSLYRAAPGAQTASSLQTRLLASRMHVSGGVALPAELLTLDGRPLERLEEMT
jgi:uncharacterized phage protein gp47/JayE